EDVLSHVPGVRPETVFAERVVGKPYLEIDIDREAVGRYGLSIVDLQEALQIAVGGVALTRTVEGRERYPVRVRLMRERRDSLEALRELPLPTPAGIHVPLGQVASLRYVHGPEMIRAEDTFLTSYVIFDRAPDVAEVTAARRVEGAIREAIDDGTLELPEGVSYELAGSYQNQIRSERRLKVLVPLALVLVFILLYLQFQHAVKSILVFAEAVISNGGASSSRWHYSPPCFLDIAHG